MTQGLYNIDNSIPSPNENAYMEAGIQENVEFTDVIFDKTANDNMYLAFYFKNEKGHKGTHTEWPFKGTLTEDNAWIIQKQAALIKQIGEAILGKGNFNIKANSFEEMANAVVQALKPAINGKQFRVKVVYDNRGFTSLANNPKWPFIESMSIAKENSRIQILSTDKMIRPQRDVEKPVENVLEETGSTQTEGIYGGNNPESPF